MSLFDWFADRRKTAPAVRTNQEPDEGDGLWSKCPECSLVVYRKDLIANASVCSGCGYHHRIDSDERIRLLADPGSFEPLDSDLAPTDPIEPPMKRKSITPRARGMPSRRQSPVTTASRRPVLRWLSRIRSA